MANVEDALLDIASVYKRITFINYIIQIYFGSLGTT